MRGILGQGQYGVVILVQCVSSSNTENELSALKVIWKQRFNKDELSVIRSEATILQKLMGQDHIVQIKNVS